MHEPASYISLLVLEKTDLASTNIEPIKMNYVIKGRQKYRKIVFETISAELNSELNM